jgi:hypothetical protein
LQINRSSRKSQICRWLSAAGTVPFAAAAPTPPEAPLLPLLAAGIPTLLQQLADLVRRRPLHIPITNAAGALASIGCAVTSAVVAVRAELAFDLGSAHGFAQAEVLDPNSYDSDINLEPCAWIGLLAVLSLRYRRRPLRQIRWRGKICRLVGTDVFRSTIAVDQGLHVSLPAFDPLSLRALRRPFDEDDLPPIGKVSDAFVARAASSVEKYRELAVQALAELSFATELPLNVTSLISAVPDETPATNCGSPASARRSRSASTRSSPWSSGSRPATPGAR